MSSLIIMYGCHCHSGNMYILDSDNRVSKIVYECKSNDRVLMGYILDLNYYNYKEVTSIQTIIDTILSDLT